MKTALIQTFPSSVYLLAVPDAAMEERCIVKTGNDETKNVSLPEDNNVIDTPENWDEAWFANYE